MDERPHDAGPFHWLLYGSAGGFDLYSMHQEDLMTTPRLGCVLVTEGPECQPGRPGMLLTHGLRAFLACLVMMSASTMFAEKRAIPEREVTTPEGAFLFSELALETMDFSHDTIHLLAKITNKTPRTWNHATFEIVFLRSDGQKMVVEASSPSRYTVGKLLPGADETRTGVGVEYRIAGDAKEITDCVITFLVGEPVASYAIEMIKPLKSASHYYSTQAYAIQFSFYESRIGIVLANKSAQPITVDWNKISYIGPDKRAQKVIHSGIRYSAKEERQEPTVVPPGSEISEELIPVGGIALSDDGWKEADLFPADIALAKTLDGATFGIFLPMEIGTIQKPLSFEFRVAAK